MTRIREPLSESQKIFLDKSIIKTANFMIII
jgi:hypothetical protein